MFLEIESNSKLAEMMERVPVQPVKRSSRFENSNTPTMTKAKKLKDYKDNAGTNFNPFTVL